MESRLHSQSSEATLKELGRKRRFVVARQVEGRHRRLGVPSQAEAVMMMMGEGSQRAGCEGLMCRLVRVQQWMAPKEEEEGSRHLPS